MLVPTAQVYLLVEAMQSLAMLPTPPMISCEPYSHKRSTLKAPMGHRHLLTRLALDRHGFKEDRGDLHPALLLDAITISRYPLKSLSFFGDDGDQVSCEIFKTEIGNPMQTPAYWLTLTSLRLQLNTPNDGWTAASTVALRGLLAHAQNLDDLLLSTEIDAVVEPAAGNSMSQLATSISSRVLKTVCLICIYATAVDFRDFMLRHRKTLKSLSLSLCRLPMNNRWETVLQPIIQDLKLEELRFESMWAGNRRLECYENNQWEHVSTPDLMITPDKHHLFAQDTIADEFWTQEHTCLRNAGNQRSN